MQQDGRSFPYSNTQPFMPSMQSDNPNPYFFPFNNIPSQQFGHPVHQQFGHPVHQQFGHPNPNPFFTPDTNSNNNNQDSINQLKIDVMSKEIQLLNKIIELSNIQLDGVVRREKNLSNKVDKLEDMLDVLIMKKLYKQKKFDTANDELSDDEFEGYKFGKMDKTKKQPLIPPSFQKTRPFPNENQLKHTTQSPPKPDLKNKKISNDIITDIIIEQIPADSCCSNPSSGLTKPGSNSNNEMFDGGMIIQIVSDEQDGAADLPSILKMLGGLTKYPGIGPGLQKNQQPKTKLTNIEEEVEETESEYDSSDEVEELNLNIKNIDDLINLGGTYLEKSSKPKTPETKPKNKHKNKNKNKNNNNNNNNKNGYGSGSGSNNGTKYATNTHDISSSHNISPNNTLNTGSNSSGSNSSETNSLDNTSSLCTLKNTNMSKEKEINFVIDSNQKSIISKMIPPPIQKKKNNLYELNGKKYSINLETLHNLIKPLTKLKKLIGLTSIKESITDMILYYLQNFEKQNKNMLHTVIEGPPGVGKTEVGKILAEIYAALGILPSAKFKLVRRTDLIGEYVGQTGQKTQRVIDEADGGVLFIDEAYSLGSDEKRDTFSKECIDVLNQNLSENKKKFICIIAGYANELETCFFSANPGLQRRFPFRFKIDGYSPLEIKDIFLKKINDSNWKFDKNDIPEDKLIEFFKKNKDNFPHYGGDIDTLFIDCKFSHAKRIIGKSLKLRRILTNHDILNGFERYVKNKNKKEDLEFINHMYA
jgi:hypothetical protein